MKFSRGFESDADYLGVEYMYKAGYDPQAFTSFFEKIQSMEKRKPGTISKAFDTHPQTPDRIAKTQEEIRTLLPAEKEYKLDSSEFQDVKLRLAELENRHKLDLEHGGTAPVLRRPTHSPNDTAGASANDDGPPVLHRKDQ